MLTFHFGIGKIKIKANSTDGKFLLCNYSIFSVGMHLPNGILQEPEWLGTHYMTASSQTCCKFTGEFIDLSAETMKAKMF